MSKKILIVSSNYYEDITNMMGKYNYLKGLVIYKLITSEEGDD